MSIKEVNAQLISVLADAAATLSVVTNSDDAINKILARIEELAAVPESEQIQPTPGGGGRAVIREEVDARIKPEEPVNQCEASKDPLIGVRVSVYEAVRVADGDKEQLAKLYRLVSQDPESTLADVKYIAQNAGRSTFVISI